MRKQNGVIEFAGGGGPKHIFGNFTIMLVEEILFFPGRGPPNYPLDPRMCVYIYRGLRFILSNRAYPYSCT